MTQENKQLLLKDLCARLPHKVIIKSVGENKIIGLWDLRYIDNLPLPYLRPMSSMTIGERKRFLMLKGTQRGYITENGYHEDKEMYPVEGNCAICCHLNSYSRNIDWLNAHHFDYRGLIEKGLALEAPKEMYKLK